ncbi:MAG: adenine phosphoribosyltransferase [Gemmatimonadetes bacterium]|nr:adenine phosphoribosyltransferase [Gemmatimonadota bacterium]MCH8144335.1 adenine phosphoribosyltransferase [Gemmatimonadota bacterium]MCH8935349.1 adenine phosphoribosyltransferase [Gemmatimonadota bacterium]
MSKKLREKFYGAIRDVPDFPEKGIVFKDITPLLLDPKLLDAAVQQICDEFQSADVEKVMAIESRGFIFGAPVALRLGAGLVLARKAGKLPWKRHRVEYALEYGTDVIEVHVDSIAKGERVLVVDDVLATGGTAEAAGRVVEQAGGQLVGMAFLLELDFLHGRQKLEGIDVRALLSYD